MRLYEEFKEYETLWEDLDKSTAESFTEIKKMIGALKGWKITDVQQAADQMTLKCTLADGIYVWQGEQDYVKEVKDIAKRSMELGIHFDIEDTGMDSDVVLVKLKSI